MCLGNGEKGAREGGKRSTCLLVGDRCIRSYVYGSGIILSLYHCAVCPKSALLVVVEISIVRLDI